MGTTYRRSEYDVTNRVNVTEPSNVCDEVCRLYLDLYPGSSVTVLKQAFTDLARLFRGEYPGYWSCETPYHDLQHVLDVTLAMGRLIHGYESLSEGALRIGKSRALWGIIAALFHDSGYIRSHSDYRHPTGAGYTTNHVSRGGKFLARYLPTIEMECSTRFIIDLIHYTGYERTPDEIGFEDSKLSLLGCMLGSADLLAQMSDRCYLEKSRDRLYVEFNIAYQCGGEGSEKYSYASPQDLILKTPAFVEHVFRNRLDGCLEKAHRYAETFFNGTNTYIQAISGNLGYRKDVVNHSDIDLLRRNPPWTLANLPLSGQC